VSDAVGAAGRSSDQHSIRLLRSSAVVGLGTALSRITGFLRVAAIAYAIGAGALAGTYSYASQTPNMLYELLLGGVLTATLVPQFVRHVEHEDDEAVSAIMTVAIAVLVVLTVAGILLAPYIVEVFTLRAEGASRAAQQDVATTLVRLFMPMILFFGFTALATALLNAHRRFAAAAFAPILNNIVVISIFVSLPRLFDGPITLERVRDDTALLVTMGLGTTAGVAAVAIALGAALRWARIRLRFVLAWRHRAVLMMARLSVWTVGYVIANQVALWIVLVLANGRDGGPFIYLSAYAFFQLPHGLLAVSLMTTLAPEMASAAGRSEIRELRERLSFGLRLTTFVIVPCSALFIALARPMVVALLERGAFSSGDATVVAHTVAGFSLGLVPFSLYLFSLRAFYSLQDTRTPFFLNCFENALNIAFAFPLYYLFGVPGLAVAFAGAYGGASVVTLLALRRRLGRLDGRRLVDTLARSLAAGGLVALVTWLIARGLGWSSPWAALGTTVVGVIVGLAEYVAVTAALRMRELDDVWSLFAPRVRRGAEPPPAVAPDAAFGGPSDREGRTV
jgi:putative peptidoglycan lipid II flippase